MFHRSLKLLSLVAIMFCLHATIYEATAQSTCEPITVQSASQLKPIHILEMATSASPASWSDTVDWIPNQDAFIAINEDGSQLLQYNLNDINNPTAVYQSLFKQWFSLKFSPDGTYLLVDTIDGDLLINTLTSEKIELRVEEHILHFSSVFLLSRNVLFSTNLGDSSQRALLEWQLSDGHLSQRIKLPPEPNLINDLYWLIPSETQSVLLIVKPNGITMRDLNSLELLEPSLTINRVRGKFASGVLLFILMGKF